MKGSMMVAVLAVLVLLLAVPPVRGHVITAKAGEAGINDTIEVNVKLKLTGEKPKKVGDEGTVVVTLIPTVNVRAVQFDVTLAGGAEAQAPRDFSKARPVRPYIKGLEAGGHFSRKLTDLRVGRPLSFPVKFKLSKGGYGYIMGSVSGYRDQRTPITSESVSLFFLATETGAFFSRHSMRDLDVQKLRLELTRKRLPKEEIQKRINRLRRGGAKVEKKSSPGSKPGGGEGAGNSITVEGNVQFTDISGGTHPVRFATVQIWDDEGAVADELVATTTTDADGDYSVTVDDNDGDGTGRDIYVVVRAECDTVVVEDVSAPNDVLEIDSGPPINDVPDHTTQTINITATNNDASPQNVAFEAYEAVNTLSRYLVTLGEPVPGAVTVRYPGTGDGSSYFPWSQQMNLAGTDVHDWDNIQHEYGHHIQKLYGNADNPGGPHSSCSNLCSTKGKDAGTRMSWAEAWPTAFSIMAQNEMGLDAMGIPNLGDTSYTDTKPPPTADFGYDLEVEDGCSQGEGVERAIMRTFWDLYDNVDDAADAGVSLPAAELWDASTYDDPLRFSDFWNNLVAARSEAEKISFGAICAFHNIASDPTSPADGTVYAGGATPTFQWDGNLGCVATGNARYSVRFYNDPLTALIWASPWQTATSFTPSTGQRDNIFAGPDGTIRWAVASKDLTPPETGVYYSGSRTIVDDFDVPDRTPVDIILALDVSGSMSGTVPGSDTSLKKIELLKQAVEVFVRTWGMHAVDGDRIGVVYFSSHTSSMAGTPPILVEVTGNVENVVSDVVAKAAGGCTALGGAIQVGYDNLTSGDNKKVIILFSDGIQTANPLVDEEGSPPKLKIRVVPVGGTLPFGAFFCTTTTAEAPDGSTIVPDGQFLDEHDVEVHTIGVGVDGASFEELIERIADETDALHLFTSAPDEELDIFYTNDLVDSLKTSTLELVKTDKGAIAKGTVKTLSVPVNKLAKSLTIVLSWKGELKENALAATFVAPSGQTIAPTAVSHGEFFTIAKLDFPLSDVETPIDHWGNWTVRMEGQSDVDSLKYQFSAIIDEPCLDFSLSFPRRDFFTGQPILLTATVTQSGAPVPATQGIWVDVTAPTQPSGNLLATYLPRLTPEQLRAASRAARTYDTRFDALVATLLSKYPKVAAMTRSKTVSTVRLYDDGRGKHGDRKAGDGVYSNLLTTTRLPGNYNFRLNVLASTRCGRVARTQTASCLVNIQQFHIEKSDIKALRKDKNQYVFSFRPADRFGNLLGPGHRESIRISSTSGKLVGAVVDRLDGSYEQLISVIPGDNPRIGVEVKGDQLYRAPLSTLVRNSRK